MASMPPPIRLDRYEVLEPIGMGSFACVYKARQRSTGQLVAVKTIRAVPHEPDAYRQRVGQRFVRETRLCAELSHPNIVRLLDSGETADGGLYAILEYVPGRTLQRVLAEEGALSRRETLRLMMQILDALACAHRRGILHRDLKPANIMLAESGARRNALVLDFGLGAFVETRSRDPRLTSAHELIGTPAYAAPEQLRGEGATTRSDIYSWGLVLYECLTGRQAARGRTLHDVLHWQLGSQSLTIPAETCDEALRTVLERATVKNPDSRAGAVTELLDALEVLSTADVGDRSAFDRAPAATPAPRPAVPSAALSPPDGRQLVAVSCRIAVRTAAGMELPGHDAERLLREARAACAQAARDHGGSLAGGTADHFLAVFGYWQTAEHATRRAVRTANAILERTAVTAGSETAISVAIGLHSGSSDVWRYAAAAPPRGSESARVFDTAMALSDRAHAGEIVLSHPVVESMHRNLAVSALDPIVLGEQTTALAIYRLVAADPSLVRQTPWVGRHEELRVLTHAWDTACAGIPQSVLIIGEPGAGKTRLIAELRRRLSRAACIEWRCAADASGSPLHPVIEWLVDAVGDVSMTEFLSARGCDASAAPVIGALIAAETAAAVHDETAPQRRRAIVFDVFITLIRAAAAREPTLFVIEDLHWADPTTLELVTAILDDFGYPSGDPQTRSMTCVLSSRPAALLPSNLRDVTTLQLAPLSHSDVCEMLAAAMPAGEAISGSLLEHIVRRTEGVPLFVEEFAWLLSTGADTGEQRIPAGVRDLFAPRLHGLSNAARHIVQAAAIIGREFNLPLLAAVTPFSDAELDDALQELCERGLFVRRSRRGVPQYAFKHILMRDAAYETLSDSARRRLHEVVAREITDRFATAPGDDPAMLALHWERAGILDEAIRLWQLAAEKALATSAVVEAAAHFERAITLLSSVPESSDRHERELDLQLRLGPTLAAFEGYASARTQAAFARAEALCASVGNSPRLLSAVNGIWAYHLVRGERRPTQASTDRLLTLADTHAYPECELACAHALGLTAFYAGEFLRAVHFLTRSQQLLSEMTSAGAAQPADMRAYTSTPLYLAWALLHIGYPECSRSLLEQSMAAAQRSGDAALVAEVANHSLAFWHDVDEPALVLSLAGEVVWFCRDRGLDYWRFVAESVHGWARAHAGEADGGVAQIQAAHARYRATGAETPYAYRVVYEVDALMQAGRVDDGLALVDDTLARFAGNLDRFSDAELHRLRGALLGCTGNHARAADAFVAARQLAQMQGTRWLALRAAISAACCDVSAAYVAEARAWLRAEYDQFTEGQHTRPMRAARAILSLGD